MGRPTDGGQTSAAPTDPTSSPDGSAPNQAVVSTPPPGATQIGDSNIYIDPTTKRAVYVQGPVPTALHHLPPDDAAAVLADRQRMMQVHAESLDDFASKLSAAHQQAFGSGAAAPPQFDPETNVPGHHLGTFPEATDLSKVYAPLQQQVASLLAELDQLVADMHAKVQKTGQDYRFSDQTAQTATNEAGGPIS
jgi:hypothetical protein